ncbi:MAG: DNA polymerase IV, partial [Defluviimonas sp.]|nr:DNA polymerase IV [Defluviimonas sp.]
GAGIRTFDDLRRWERAALTARFGRFGTRLWHLARGEDARAVDAHAPLRSISNETTFTDDIADADLLEGHLWRLAEKVTDRAKARGLAGAVATLKLKRADHRLLSRRETLREPTQLADTLYSVARGLMVHDLRAGPFRLIGVGLSGLGPAAAADRTADLLDPGAARRAGAERAADAIRARFGPEAIVRGRALR